MLLKYLEVSSILEIMDDGLDNLPKILNPNKLKLCTPILTRFIPKFFKVLR